MTVTPVAPVLVDALALIELGVPVFLAKPNKGYRPGTAEEKSKDKEFVLPPEWQKTPADPATVAAYVPGDALCAVMGHTVDAVDVDLQNGGDVKAEAQRLQGLGVPVIGMQGTPGGGAHFLIPATGIHSAAKPSKGVDFRGGGVDGSGRGFIFLAGTERPKYAGKGYQLAMIPTAADLDLLEETRQGITDSCATYLNAVGIKPRTEGTETSTEVVGGEPVTDISAALQMELDKASPVGERSEKFHALVGKIHREGFTQGQAVTLLTPWCNTNGKFVGRVAQEVARSLGGIKRDELKALEYLENRGEHLSVTETAGAATEATEGEVSTWLPLDLEPFLNGTHTPLEPSIFQRTDNQFLIYPGKLHSIYGESESGKSFVAQYICAIQIMLGQKVLYIDFEDSPAEMIKRLQLFGATAKDIRENFSYIQPWHSLNSSNRQVLGQVLETPWKFVVIDGFTVAMNLIAPASGTPEAQVAEFMAALPKRIIKTTNAAVLTVDHVVKSKDARGRFALGSQEKLNQVTGAAYVLEVSQAIFPGARGCLVLRVTKDRIGQIRANSGPWRASDRTQETARIMIDSTEPGYVNVLVEPHANGAKQFRPTHVMESISEYLETCPDAVNVREIKENTKGKAEIQVAAIQILVSEGYVERVAGARGANLHKSLKPFRELNDFICDSSEGND